jgi:hypothetical protein
MPSLSRSIQLITILFAATANYSSAKEPLILFAEDVACKKLDQKIPKDLSRVKRLAPLQKEMTDPDLDYCHENFSQCDIRTLVFADFSLRLLHEKTTSRVSLHVAEFASLKKAKEICGPSCVSSAVYDKSTKKYVVDCQANI